MEQRCSESYHGHVCRVLGPHKVHNDGRGTRWEVRCWGMAS